MDDTDIRILRALQSDGRLTNQQLSELVGLSPSPCLRRVRALEEAGVIAGYAAHLDERVVGLPVTVFVSVKLERQIDTVLAEFEAAITRCPEVMDCFLMTGTQDYLLRIVASGLDDYERFLTQTLTKIAGVASIESSFALRRVKGTQVLPL